ncbi:hypothetical protein N24_0172 [Corynebacterium suranareeae]|uniref:Uncharacterized protein n=1 Tax=Corynebacterium suranareeae TaxID=2506452 RepID=A0A160PME4_9CORY|nr:hypothetical protein [Corynebacterium suranareeae]BAU94434.1 hypothetical protein N24_0172 [Corynebacterium suranareeae]
MRYAKTLQGETIRIAGRVSDEFHGNDGINWEKDYKKMVKSLLAITAEGNPLPDPMREELEAAVKHVKKGEPSDADIDTLPRIATVWVRANPDPIPMWDAEYRR